MFKFKSVQPPPRKTDIARVYRTLKNLKLVKSNSYRHSVRNTELQRLFKENIPSFNCRHSVLDTESQSLSKENPSRPSLEKGRSTGKVAFTLAEVLITLGIIGVVAAITIPTMIANYREKVTVTRLTQTYSLLSQAIDRMIEDEGRAIQDWGATSEKRLAKFEELLPKYIQIVKKCEKMKKGCLSPAHYKLGVIGAPADDWTAGPNKTDIDAFQFVVVQNGIVPAGSAKEQIWTERFDQVCAQYRKYGSTGKCTAWVIHNKNMDYLKCPEKLGWKKASSCK